MGYSQNGMQMEYLEFRSCDNPGADHVFWCVSAAEGNWKYNKRAVCIFSGYSSGQKCVSQEACLQLCQTPEIRTSDGMKNQPLLNVCKHCTKKKSFATITARNNTANN